MLRWLEPQETPVKKGQWTLYLGIHSNYRDQQLIVKSVTSQMLLGLNQEQVMQVPQVFYLHKTRLPTAMLNLL